MIVETEDVQNRGAGQGEQIVLPELEPIDVLDFRDLEHQKDIAKALADRKQLVMYAGIWAGFKAVGADSKERSIFERTKIGRPNAAKIVVVATPSRAHELTDWSMVHEDYRFLEDPEMFERLWGGHGAHLHVITPVRKDLKFPETFLTKPEDHASLHPDDDPLPTPTASFFWRQDPYLENLMTLVEGHSDETLFIGGTSLNRHGESPPYTYNEFRNHLDDGKIDRSEVGIVARDSEDERLQIHGSHTQIQIPLLGWDGSSIPVRRIGTLSPEGFEAATGFATRVMPDAKDVKRFPRVNIDDRIIASHDNLLARWKELQS